MRKMIFLGSLVVLTACSAKTEVQSDSTQADSVTVLPTVITEDTATITVHLVK